jgi:hypothetical protein
VEGSGLRVTNSAIAIVATGLTACSGLFDPSGLRVDFTREASEPPGAPAAVEGLEKGMRIQGSYTSDTCHRERADARRAGDTLVFTLELVRKRGVCASPALDYDYAAVVRGVPPGTYMIRVEHLQEPYPVSLELEEQVVVQ